MKKENRNEREGEKRKMAIVLATKHSLNEVFCGFLLGVFVLCIFRLTVQFLLEGEREEDGEEDEGTGKGRPPQRPKISFCEKPPREPKLK